MTFEWTRAIARVEAVSQKRFRAGAPRHDGPDWHLEGRSDFFVRQVLKIGQSERHAESISQRIYSLRNGLRIEVKLEIGVHSWKFLFYFADLVFRKPCLMSPPLKEKAV